MIKLFTSSFYVAFEKFNKAKKADLINEKRPKAFYTKQSTQSIGPIGPYLRNKNLKPYPEITNIPENPVLDCSLDGSIDKISPKTLMKSYVSKNSITSNVTNATDHKTMALINNLAKNSKTNDKPMNKSTNDYKSYSSSNSGVFGPNLNSNKQILLPGSTLTESTLTNISKEVPKSLFTFSKHG